MLPHDPGLQPLMGMAVDIFPVIGITDGNDVDHLSVAAPDVTYDLLAKQGFYFRCR
jgi:hypothetical protein